MKFFSLSVFAVLATIAPLVYSQSNAQFTKLFKSNASIREIAIEMMNTHPEKSYQLFKEIQQHIQKKDKYASYCQKFLNAGQQALDNMLRAINYNGKVEFPKIVEAAYDTFTGEPASDAKMEKLAKQLISYIGRLHFDAFEDAKNEAVDRLLGTDNNQVKTKTPVIEPKENPAPVYIGGYREDFM